MNTRSLRFGACALSMLLSLSACKGSDSPQDPAVSNIEDRITEQERRELVPNDLFRAVLNGRFEEAEEIVRVHPELLRSVNVEHGETPLAMALRLENEEMAARLLQRIPNEHLTALNNRSESYVFLAARAGFPQIIRDIADRKFNTLGTFERFDFTDLDLTDEQGRTALFVARDRHTAEALREQFDDRGVLMEPWWSFFQVQDNESRSFLHWAAAENRTDIIQWAVESLCRNDPAPDEGLMGKAWRGLVDTQMALQFQFGDWYYWGDLIVNREDSAKRTALHYAAGNLSVEAIQALQSCAWLDPFVRDNNGQTFLHLYLAGLDRRADRIDDDLVAAIAPIANFESSLQALYTRRAELLEARDHDGRTPLHLAASIRDPRPYQALMMIRPITTVDNQGLTPEQIREQALQAEREATDR